MLSKSKKRDFKKIFLRGKSPKRFYDIKEYYLDKDQKVRLYKTEYTEYYTIDKWYNQKEVKSWLDYPEYVKDIKYNLEEGKVYVYYNSYSVSYRHEIYSFFSNKFIEDGIYTIQQLIDTSLNEDHLLNKFSRIRYTKPNIKNLEQIEKLKDKCYKISRLYSKTTVYRNRNKLTSKLRKILIEEDYNNDLLSSKKDLFEEREFLW